MSDSEIESLRAENETLRSKLERADKMILDQLQTMRTLNNQLKARNKYAAVRDASFNATES